MPPVILYNSSWGALAYIKTVFNLNKILLYIKQYIYKTLIHFS